MRIEYTRAQIEAVGEELVYRVNCACRCGAPLTRDERSSLMEGVYATLCATAANLAETYSWLQVYEDDILLVDEEV